MSGGIGVGGGQLGEARGAQMNEGGELRRESRAESWNRRIAEMRNHWSREGTGKPGTWGGYEGEKEYN